MSKVTHRENTALYALMKFGAQSPAELARRCATSPEGVSRTAASLVRKGLVNRYKLSGKVRYELTDRGAAMAPPPVPSGTRGPERLSRMFPLGGGR
jgi:DNA-binding MarR family transcriptional regulator